MDQHHPFSSHDQSSSQNSRTEGAGNTSPPCQQNASEQIYWLKSGFPRSASPPWLNSFEGHLYSAHALAITADGTHLISDP